MLARVPYQLKAISIGILVQLGLVNVARATSESLNNPIASTSMQAFLLELVGIVQIIIVPFVVVFVIYAGFTYVVARGNPESIQRANRALIYALIGTLIIFGAQAIGDIVKDTVTSF